MPAPRAPVNSIHHQGIKDLAPGFVVEARCPDDGMIEAIRRARAGMSPGCSGTRNSTTRRPATFDDMPMLHDFLAAPARPGTP